MKAIHVKNKLIYNRKKVEGNDKENVVKVQVINKIFKYIIFNRDYCDKYITNL